MFVASLVADLSAAPAEISQTLSLVGATRAAMEHNVHARGTRLERGDALRLRRQG